MLTNRDVPLIAAFMNKDKRVKIRDVEKLHEKLSNLGVIVLPDSDELRRAIEEMAEIGVLKLDNDEIFVVENELEHTFLEAIKFKSKALELMLEEMERKGVLKKEERVIMEA